MRAACKAYHCFPKLRTGKKTRRWRSPTRERTRKTGVSRLLISRSGQPAGQVASSMVVYCASIYGFVPLGWSPAFTCQCAGVRFCLRYVMRLAGGHGSEREFLKQGDQEGDTLGGGGKAQSDFAPIPDDSSRDVKQVEAQALDPCGA